MKKLFSLSLILSLACLFSCGTSRTVPGTYQYNDRATLVMPNPEAMSESITQSLFQDQGRTISEADIQRLLDGEIKIPDSARLALYKISASSNSIRRYYSYQTSNEELLKWQQNQIETLSESINNSRQVSKVMLMPSLLTHNSPNLTNLRESAVRMQADLLLIFSIKKRPLL